MTKIAQRFVIGRNCWETDLDEYPDYLRRMRESGYRGWEFGCRPDRSPLPPTPGMLTIGQLSDHRARRLRVALQEYDFVCAHAPFWHDEGVSVLVPNAALREASIALLGETLDFAAGLGAHAMCFHLGHNWLPNDQSRPLLRDSLGKLLAIADRCGVTLALENVPGELTFNLDALAALVAEVAHPRLKILLDTGHATLAPGPNQPRPLDPSQMIADFTRAHGDEIIEMHLHDNDGAGDRHWPIGRGLLDWPRIAAAIVDSKTPAALIIEASDPDQSRAPLEGYLREACGVR
jgi:sugar phosphate isomerase/epimerase